MYLHRLALATPRPQILWTRCWAAEVIARRLKAAEVALVL